MKLNKHLYYIVPILLTAIVLLGSIGNDWTNWDDDVYVLNNDLVLNPSFKSIFTTLEVQGNYHPITISSLALDHLLFGLNASGFHTTNLLLHLINVLLVFVLARRLGAKELPSAIVALIFGIHPMHVESVAWISGRKDLLYTLFYLLGLIYYLKQLDFKSTKNYLLILSFFGLSLLSKGMAVVFPISLFLIDFLKGRKLGVKSIVEKVPFIALSIVVGVVTIQAQAEVAAFSNERDLAFFDRILVGMYGIMYYLKQLILPYKFSAFHPYPDLANGLPYTFYVAVVALLVAGFFIFKKGGRLLQFGFLFFLLNIVLVLQVLSVGHAIVAERYTYLAYVGPLLVLALYWDRLESKGKFVQLYLPLMFVAYFGVQSFQQVPKWKNSITLWESIIEQYPEDYFAYGSLGNTYLKENKPKQAIKHLEKSIALNPNFSDTQNNLGLIYMRMGAFGKALPSLSKAIDLDSTNALAFFNRGLIYAEIRKPHEAIQDYSRAAELDKKNPMVFVKRGYMLMVTGRKTEAYNDFEKALKLNKKPIPEVYFYQSLIHADSGNIKEAVQFAEKALRMGYSVPPEYYNNIKAKLAKGSNK